MTCSLPGDAFLFGSQTLMLVALIFSSLVPAHTQEGDPTGSAVYIPGPSFEAPASSSAPSPSQLAQNNHTVDPFNRAQDTYVIAVGLYLCHMPVNASSIFRDASRGLQQL